MKKHILVMLLLLGSGIAIQGKSKYHLDLNYSYNLGISESIVGKHYGRSEYNMGGNSLRLSARYDVSKQWSMGAGVGVERYTNLDFNTFPAFVTLRYTPLQNHSNVYAFTDIGYAVEATDDSNPGFTGKLGVGYIWHIANHFGITIQIAYDYKDFRKIPTSTYNEIAQQTIYSTSNSIRHSVSFGLGLTF